MPIDIMIELTEADKEAIQALTEKLRYALNNVYGAPLDLISDLRTELEYGFDFLLATKPVSSELAQGWANTASRIITEAQQYLPQVEGLAS